MNFFPPDPPEAKPGSFPPADYEPDQETIDALNDPAQELPGEAEDGQHAE